MFFKSFIQLALSLALTHVTDAIIWPSAGILITDTYDNLSPGVPVDGLGNQVGYYNGLDYNNFLVKPSIAGTPDGVVPASPPNTAAAAAIVGQSHYITVQGSPFKTFDLVSLFLGCESQAAQGAASPAIGCQMSVECLKPDGSQAGSRSFGFFLNPVGNTANATMQKTVFPVGGTTYGVQTCIFGVTASTTVPETTNFLFDNLTHIMHY